jgi:hypothetical protein
MEAMRKLNAATLDGFGQVMGKKYLYEAESTRGRSEHAALTKMI